MGKENETKFEAALENLAGTGAGKRQMPGPGVQTEADEHPSVSALTLQFGDAILRHEQHAGDEHVVFVAPDRLRDIMQWLKGEPGQHFDLLKDVTCVDYGGGRPIQVVYELWSIEHRRQLRVKVELPLDALEVESVTPIWATANWHEREAYDMFGVQFRNHPDLRRILMPENYQEGHPLRKDFPLRGRFSRAEQTRRALALDMEDYYLPDELKLKERKGETTPEPGAQRALPETAGQPGGARTVPGSEGQASEGDGA
ncbi:MAG: NADH-quinone oxidoreductase subunit C [Gemmatimonadota bacterium]|jgi:NADH-quinone oxidoreductase subunit C